MRNGAFNQLGLLAHVAILLAVCVRNRHQHSAETGATIVVVGREIGSPIKRLSVRSEKGSKRPAALPADGLNCNLITAVNIGTFVAIDLNGDEALIDDLRDFRILVGFAVHHVTPMTPHRSDVEQDGLVLPLGDLECLVTPFMPLDRLMHGGAQVGGGGAGEGVEDFGLHDSSVTASSWFCPEISVCGDCSLRLLRRLSGWAARRCSPCSS